jgi:hypothetical protein
MMSEIDDALGLPPIGNYIEEVTPINLPAVIQDEQKDNDLDFARENLYDAVVKSQAAVEDMIAIAQQSQHPKAYEVLNSLIKTFADVSSGIADLQLKKQRLQGKEPEQQKTVNNNLFVGSTAELQKMLEDLKKDV